MRVLFPDGTSILAHGRLDVVPPERPRAPDVALYLDVRWTTDPEVTWPFTFVPWEDFALPDDEEGLFRALGDAWAAARSGKLVEIACGHRSYGDRARLPRRSSRGRAWLRRCMGAEQLPPLGGRSARAGGAHRSLRRMAGRDLPPT